MRINLVKGVRPDDLELGGEPRLMFTAPMGLKWL
jgi:hypothetical protein